MTDSECSEADFQMNQYYLYKDTVQQCCGQAIKLLRAADRKFHTQALKSFAFSHQQRFGVEKDLFKTVQLLTAVQKNNSEASFLLMGNFFFNGEEFHIKTTEMNSKEFV